MTSNDHSSQPSIIAEVQTMKLLKHPNILPLYAAFSDDDQLWMVMPYVSGGSASDIMRRTAPNVGSDPAYCTLNAACLQVTHDQYGNDCHSVHFQHVETHAGAQRALHRHDHEACVQRPCISAQGRLHPP